MTATETHPQAVAATGPASQPLLSGHPMDSSRILLAMTAMARRAADSRDQWRSRGEEEDDVSSLIAQPVLRTLLSALHYRDPGVMAHSRRVALLGVGMAQQLGWEGRPLRVLETAALLHDIGKIGIADSILTKPGKLTSEESGHIALHHNTACNLLQALRVDHEVVSLVGQSHHFYNKALDGSGVIGGEVRQGARVLAVADAYDSLTHEQAYRAAMHHDEAIAALTEGAGSRFDGNVVAALDRWIRTDGLSVMMNSADARLAADPASEMGTAASIAAQEAGMLAHIFSYLHTLESLYDAFYVLDSDCKFVVWSPGAEQLLSRQAGTMIGQPYSRNLFANADPSGSSLAEHECPVRQVTTDGRAALRKLKLAGTNTVVEVQSIPLIDADGRLQGVAQILSDDHGPRNSAGQYRELKAAASRDALTGVANRGELESQMEKLFESWRAEKEQDPFCVVFTDIDHFKQINDTYGHAVGDRVLTDFAKTLQEEVYPGELVARYGGEEFVIVCPGSRLTEVAERAERLRLTLSQLRFEDTPQLTLTSSFGIAEVQQGDNTEKVFKRADAALFRAKETGRNRVCLPDGSAFGHSQVNAPDTKTKPAGPLEWNGRMESCTQSDMIVYKISGFVNDVEADLCEVNDRRVLMRLGKAGWLNRWGTTGDRQPIEVELQIGDERDGRGSAKYIPIRVAIRPIGRVGSVEQFNSRCGRVVENLRAFLLARD